MKLTTLDSMRWFAAALCLLLAAADATLERALEWNHLYIWSNVVRLSTFVDIRARAWLAEGGFSRSPYDEVGSP